MSRNPFHFNIKMKNVSMWTLAYGFPDGDPIQEVSDPLNNLQTMN